MDGNPLPNQPSRTSPGDRYHPLHYGQHYPPEALLEVHPNRLPDPLLPYDIRDRSGVSGSGMRRTSMDGDKWCAYCDTPLPPDRRKRTCDDCGAKRTVARRRPTALAPRPLLVLDDETPNPRVNRTLMEVKALVDAVDDISARLGILWSDRVVTGSYSDEGISEVLEACKRAITASHPLREHVERLRGVTRSR